MLQRRFSRLSLNPSKKVSRRLRVIFEWLKSGWASFLPIILFILFVFVVYNLFIVKKIVCTLNNQDCPVEIWTKLNSEIGSNSIFINQKKLIESLKSLYPIETVGIGFKMFNTLNVSLTGSTGSYKISTYLVQKLPLITLDTAPGSSGSADWPKPSEEILIFLKKNEASNYDIWSNGTMTPAASTSAVAVKLIIDQKPNTQIVADLYNLIRLSLKYLNLQDIYALNNRVFLRQLDQPDIIVNIPFDKASITEAFQSISYLATIKKDAKVIDLRFKNPIIR